MNVQGTLFMENYLERLLDHKFLMEAFDNLYGYSSEGVSNSEGIGTLFSRIESIFRLISGVIRVNEKDA